jgi:hypothetical protein
VTFDKNEFEEIDLKTVNERVDDDDDIIDIDKKY